MRLRPTTRANAMMVAIGHDSVSASLAPIVQEAGRAEPQAPRNEGREITGFTDARMSAQLAGQISGKSTCERFRPACTGDTVGILGVPVRH